MARKLRIAVSVFFGLLTVALCVLWVRSFWVRHTLLLNTGTYTSVCANCGYFRVVRMTAELPEWKVQQLSPNKELTKRWMWDSDLFLVTAPIWIVALFTGLATALPFRSRASAKRTRFSLRTLLIATTLVAVLLGLAVWASS